MNVKLDRDVRIGVWRPDLLRFKGTMIPDWATKLTGLRIGRRYRFHEVSKKGDHGHVLITNEVGLKVWVSARGFCKLGDDVEQANTPADGRGKVHLNIKGLKLEYSEVG